MANKLEDINSVDIKIAKEMRTAGIDSIEKLASTRVEDLVKIEGINISNAIEYIQNAKILLEKAKKQKQFVVSSKKEIKNANREETNKEELVIGYINDIFSEEVIQRIRYLNNKIKHLEESLNKSADDLSLDEIDHVLEYVNILNINYKSKNQNLILKELNIEPSFHDPIENKDFNIYDVMFECARSLWILARVYTQLSEKYEDKEDWENSITAMVQCSRAYKTAAYFSAAAINQIEKGESLKHEVLELKSEEARILAQSIVALSEETRNNLFLASKLYAGLSILSKRLLYLGNCDEKIKNQLIAQSYYDVGKACHLKAQAILKLDKSNSKIKSNESSINNLQKKANFYLHKSEEIWEDMIKNQKSLSKEEKGNLTVKLSIVNECIMENDVEMLDFDEIKEIQDPKPYIAVPENLAYFLPRTTLYLSNFPPSDVNVYLFKKYKNKTLKSRNPNHRKEELLSNKAGIGRTLKELKTLYNNNDIDVDKYAKLIEKYYSKISMIELAIEKLNGSFKEPTQKLNEKSKKKYEKL